MKTKHRLLIILVSAALLIPLAAEFYVARELLALYFGFCALFTVFGLLLFLILVVEESSRELLRWVGAHIHVGQM